MSNFRPAEKNVVYIGEGVTFTGAVNARGSIVVDGSIEGETGCEQLIVGERGVVKGAISVTNADVSGTVGPDISVRRTLVVRSLGRIEGKWIYGQIEVEKGGKLNGDGEPTDAGSAERGA